MNNANKTKLYSLLKFIPDCVFIFFFYLIKTKHILHLKNPMTFNEKIQWRKIYDRKELYVQLVDKLAVRAYIKKTIGEKYLIPLIGSWDKVGDIPFDSMPDKYVLKCNHDSGSVLICNRNNGIDVEKVKRELSEGLSLNYYWRGREWAYSKVKPCIIAEQFIEEKDCDLRDYKFFCFGGRVAFVQVDIDRHTNHCRNIYSPEWELIDLQIEYPKAPNVHVEKPKNFDEMIVVAERLSKDLGHARIDLYNLDGRVLFGEITLYHGSGVEKIIPEEFDYKLGSLYEI